MCVVYSCPDSKCPVYRSDHFDLAHHYLNAHPDGPKTKWALGWLDEEKGMYGSRERRLEIQQYVIECLLRRSDPAV